MTSDQLFARIREKKSFLCVGLDTDLSKMPRHLSGAEDPIFEFNRAIVDATAPYAVCYKPNLAFYEAYGVKGLQAYQRTVAYIKSGYPEIFVIADAKRGDIGNTSRMYAQSFFEGPAAVDAVTLSPYMGRDTVDPFLSYEGHWAVLLALTSNGSAVDFEMQRMATGECLFETVLRSSKTWGTPENTMYVVGATRAAMLEDIRKIVPDHFLLVPGVGAQGGSLEEVARYGMNDRCGLLVNSSRGILYADTTENFARAAAAQARILAEAMARLLDLHL